MNAPFRPGGGRDGPYPEAEKLIRTMQGIVDQFRRLVVFAAMLAIFNALIVLALIVLARNQF